MVTDVKVEPGQVVSAGQPAIRLALAGDKEVVVAVPEGRMKGIEPGTSAVIRLWANQDQSYAARVREVAPAADAATRSFQVKVTVLEPDAGPAPGHDRRRAHRQRRGAPAGAHPRP